MIKQQLFIVLLACLIVYSFDSEFIALSLTLGVFQICLPLSSMNHQHISKVALKVMFFQIIF